MWYECKIIIGIVWLQCLISRYFQRLEIIVGIVQMLKPSQHSARTNEQNIFGAAGTLMTRHIGDGGCHMTHLPITSDIQLPPSWAPECPTTLRPSITSTFPQLFYYLEYNPTFWNAQWQDLVLVYNSSNLEVFYASCETVVALDPRGTAVIELHSNQRRNLIDFPSHSILTV